jgi:hypothetical protein
VLTFGWNIDWAVALLVDHLDQKPDTADALKNTRIRVAALEREGLAKDITNRIFNKLDKFLFAGHLKNTVDLESGSLGSKLIRSIYTQD